MNLRAEIAPARRDLARQAVGFGQTFDAEREAAWLATARQEQRLPAGDWRTWLGLGGRGSGKTKSAAEGTVTLVREGPSDAGRQRRSNRR